MDKRGSPVGASAEEIVFVFLVQVLVILLVTRLVTIFARRVLAQTDVSGEILAGVLLGPSVLMPLMPGAWSHVFGQPITSTLFVGLAQIGLILLMFEIGLEFRFLAHLRRGVRPVVVLSAVGLIVPFAAGMATADWFHARLPERTDPLGFRLFFAVAMSITAIPVLGRIFMELGLSHTRTAALTIGAAALDDVAGWLTLAVISLLISGEFSYMWALSRVTGLVLYVLVMFTLVRPVLKRVVRTQLDRRPELEAPTIAVLLMVLFLSACITSALGVFAIIGSFVVGVMLHDDRVFVEQWRLRVSPLVRVFFLPLFFAYTGLRTDVGTFSGWFGVWMCALVCAVAFISKGGGAFAAARALGEPTRSAMTIAVCMNTRALMELVVLNIGYDLGVLPKSMFTMLVIMALISTFIATPLIRVLMRGEMQAGADAPEFPRVRVAGAG